MEFKAILFLVNKYGSIVGNRHRSSTLVLLESVGEINAVLQNSFDVEVVVLVVSQVDANEVNLCIPNEPTGSDAAAVFTRLH
jgi:hypothetical protein